MAGAADGSRGATISQLLSPDPRPRAIVVVAHPDDGTLWCGYILTHPEFLWRVVTLCRAWDPDRAPKFRKVLDRFGALGEMADLDDGPDQAPSAGQLHALMNRPEVQGEAKNPHEHEGLVVPSKPYYALYSYKLFHSDRFDLLGNSLAILTGIASRDRVLDLVAWVEAECEAMRNRKELAVDLPPCLFPYILRKGPDWRPRYEQYNRPGEYHNGGVWPFICGFYVAACVAVGRMDIAKRRLLALAGLVKPWRENQTEWGFNEWIKAQTGRPSGRGWQTWSAAMYLYAAECVDQERTPFFCEVRGTGIEAGGD